jgi:hypothetical protein
MEVDEKDLSGSESLSPVMGKSRAIPTGMPVRVQLPKHVGPAKTFSIMKLSEDLDVFSLVSRATIGKSGTFCIYKNFLINHQGSVAKIKPGSLVVIKSAGKTAFLHPVIKADLFDQSLLGDWLSSQETLEDWITKFDQALALTAFATKVNAAALEVTWDEERRATDFKTPRAKKQRSVEQDTTERIGISPYARALLNGQETFEEMTPAEQLERLIQVVFNLDSGVDQLGSFYVSLSKDAEELTNSQSLSNQMLEHKVNLIRRTLGSKPEHLEAAIEAPTVWGAMAAVLEKSESTNEEPQNIPTKQQKDAGTTDGIKKSMASWETDLMVTASTLSKAIQSQGHRIDASQDTKKNISLGVPQGIVPASESWNEELKEVREEVRRLNTENKPHVVKFDGLNLDSLSKARAWISSHAAIEDIGLVVDLPKVLEHINANLSGGNFLKNFERVHKLQISTLAQGYSMSSFEQAIPKILSRAGLAVIRDDSSYLSCVATWSDWDYPDTGLRKSIKQELEVFKKAHRLEIENTLDQDSRVYTVACLALSDSVSIIEAMITFINDFVKHLTMAKFSVKKAFHVTTRLSKRIMTEMYAPRQGILKSFKVGNLKQTLAAIFWATIRSLDVGLGFKQIGMDNLHVVPSELVKFLLVNTGYESISGLEIKVAFLEAQASELQKTARNSEKSVVMATNKLDELKKTCEALTKRLTKLESKVT